MCDVCTCAYCHMSKFVLLSARVLKNKLNVMFAYRVLR